MNRFALLLVTLPLTAQAEVTDKVVAINGIVSFSAVACLASFIAARYRPLFLLLVLPAAGLLIAGDMAQTLDPYVGPALRAEAGQFRLLMPWLAAASVILATAGGFWLRRRRT